MKGRPVKRRRSNQGKRKRGMGMAAASQRESDWRGRRGVRSKGLKARGSEATRERTGVGSYIRAVL